MNLALTTDKSTYTVGDRVTINGNLTLNDNPVSDGVVAIQVNDPQGRLFVLRARPTGTNTTQGWAMEVSSIVPVTNTSGAPSYVFQRGSYLGFSVTISNRDLAAHTIAVAATVYSSTEIPFATLVLYNGTIEGRRTLTFTSYPLVQIPYGAPPGKAVAYASILDAHLPEGGGFAFSPEKTAEFDISDSSSSLSTGTMGMSADPPASPDGVCSLSFRMPISGAELGDYTIYATSFYPSGAYPYLVNHVKTFKLGQLLGDVNGDGKIDTKDIAIAAAAFGSILGQPNWNPAADLNGDFKVDVRDLAIIATNFGKTSSYVDFSVELLPRSDSVSPQSMASTTATIPWFEVSPALTIINQGSSIGTEFTISVDAVNLDASLHSVGFRFDLSYNSTLAKVVSVQEGPLFQDARWSKHGTYFTSSLEENETRGDVSVAGMLLPNSTGQWVGFPEGTGSIAYVRFSVLSRSWFETYVGDFDFQETVLVDENAIRVPTDVPQNGTLEIPPFALGGGGRVDLWIGGYPQPYGGQGANATADVVVPKQEVTLISRVTYNAWPVAQRIVLFDIRDNNLNVVALLSGRTNDTGHASVTFRMPWPDIDPENLLGVWTVTASVNVAGQIVTDKMPLEYNYPLRLWSVETDKLEYNHLESVQIEVTYGTRLHMNNEVWLKVLLQDSFGVSVGTVVANETIGGSTFGYKNYTLTVNVIVPHTASEGPALVRVDFLSKPPSAGGLPVTPGFTKTIGILPT